MAGDKPTTTANYSQPRENSEKHMQTRILRTERLCVQVNGSLLIIPVQRTIYRKLNMNKILLVQIDFESIGCYAAAILYTACSTHMKSKHVFTFFLFEKVKTCVHDQIQSYKPVVISHNSSAIYSPTQPASCTQHVHNHF